MINSLSRRGFLSFKNQLITLIFAFLCAWGLAEAQAQRVGDFVWWDLNTNGIQNVGEPGLSNITVIVYDTATNFVEITATDGNGFYEFTNLVNGSYFLSFISPIGFGITTNNAGGDDNLDSDIDDSLGITPVFAYTGTSITNLDAGYVQYQPAVQLTKTAGNAPDGTPLYITNGTDVTYTYVITNNGNTHLSTIILVDPDPGLNVFVTLLDCPSTLPPGGSLTYVTNVVRTESITNIGTVIAFPVNFKTCATLTGFDPIEDSDDAVVLIPSPGYTLEKELLSPLGRAAVVGETVQFTITLVNTGDLDLVTVPLVDTYETNYLAYVSSAPASDDNNNDGVINWANIGPIATGEFVVVTSTFTAVSSSLSDPRTNVVVASPTTPTNTPPVDPQTNDAPYEISSPGYSITKTVFSPTMPAVIGDVVTFQIQVVNTGDVTLVTVPLEDTYKTNFLSYISANPASDDSNNDGIINWTNVGPLVSGQSTNIFVAFLAITNTFGLEETNTVVAAPTVPPDEPPVPPQTSSVPYEIIRPAFLELDKDFISATEPDTNGNFQVTYTVTVLNSGEDSTEYDLVDSPLPDANVTITGGIVTGHTNLTLVGGGAYLLATNETIFGGATHVYTLLLDAVLSPSVMAGEDVVTVCGAEDGFFQAGEGLFNEVQLVYGPSDTTLNTNDCGDVPPVVVMDKDFLGATAPHPTSGVFEVSYVITVVNAGGLPTIYDLTDTPDPDGNVDILGGNLSGQASQVLVGPGPYTFATDANIGAGATHSYTVRLDAVLSAGVINGSNSVSLCSGGPNNSVAGEGLFNEAVVAVGTNNAATTNSACGDVPPFLVLEKDFISATDPDTNGNFEVTYVITVQNTGGEADNYELTDTPTPDSGVTILGGDVTGHTNLTLVGAGPYTFVTGEIIQPSATHVYTVRLDAVLSSDILTGEDVVTTCGQRSGIPQAGEGLFNEAVVTYGPSDASITNDACGEVPPVLVLEKDFVSTTDPDALGNFQVVYTVTVINSGGESTSYDFIDTPAPDTNVTISGGAVTGHTNLTLVGDGPYTVVLNELIGAGVSHVYNMRLDAVLSAGVLDGSVTVSQCSSITAPSAAGEGLFNEAVVTYGANDRSITNDACGDIPPFIVMDKTFVSAGQADQNGNFVFEYLITVENTGGEQGSYDLTDDPSPDANITISGGGVSGHIPQALVGSGPYSLAVNELIAAGATHVYTVRLNGAMSPALISGTTNATVCGQTTGTPQPGEALFNVAVVTFGDNDTTITNDACGEIPPYLIIDKTFVSASDVNSTGEFEVVYVLSVQNSGGSSTFFDLTDTPTPDGNVSITNAVVSGATNLVFSGPGPYTLATSNTILAGESLIYTMRFSAVLSQSVFEGSLVTTCGETTGTPQAGEGLFNEASVAYGTNSLVVSTNACGEIPPVILPLKLFLQTSATDASGNFTISYLVSVYNSGGSTGTYDLVDTPVPDLNVTINGASVTGVVNLVFGGAGPYTLATDVPLGPDDSHLYYVELQATIGSNILNGTVDATLCGAVTGTPLPGEALYNRSVLQYGDNDVTVTNVACGEIPPFITLDKSLIGVSEADELGNFVVSYAITVHNSGGSRGDYDLVDSPSYDTNIVVTGATVYGQSSQLTGILTTNQVFARPVNGQGYNPACLIPAAPNLNSNFPYLVFPVQASVLENFTVETVGGGVTDPYIFVYCSFDPNNPTNNILAGDDDGGPGFQAAFLASDLIQLTPFTTYDLVVSLFGTSSIGTSNLVLTFGGSILFNEPATNLPGPGPYTLATAKGLPAGSTHTYTVLVHAAYSPQVLAGDVVPTDCGLSGGGSVPGEGLFNLATVQFGDNDITFTNEACGNPPPFLVLDKDFVSVTGPDYGGNIVVRYRIEVANVGASTGFYDLVDAPIPDTNVTFSGGAVTGHASVGLLGAGPYTIMLNEAIGPGILHVYTVRLDGVISQPLMQGDFAPTGCTVPLPGEALFNRATVIYGTNDITLIDETCGEIPPAPPLFIGDTVWIDLNTNGVPDEALGTWGLNNITVELYRVTGGATNLIAVTNTAPFGGQLGYYAFSNLPYGVYISRIDLFSVPPLLSVQTTPTSYLINPAAPGFPTNGIVRYADFGLQSGSLTPIELESFTASRSGGDVLVEWVTALEMETLGFNLYRAPADVPAAKVKITTELIPGLGGENGYAYSFVDSGTELATDYLYWLEEVATDGATELFGPVAVRSAVARGVRTLASTVIDQSGVFRIGYNALAQAGVSVALVDPAKIKVLVNGEEVGAYVSSESGLLQPGDYLLFYVAPPVGIRDVVIASGDDLGLGMSWLYARPQRSGAVGSVLADESGVVEFDVDGAASRMMVAGFTQPLVWLLDITDPALPSILYGQVVVQGSDTGTYAVYFSVDPQAVVRCIAVEEDKVIEIEDISGN